jgi:acetyl-CoA C-acetyltransferase
MNLDPRTPVIIGVGQASERLHYPGYRRRSPVDLAADAARQALADTGTDPGAVARAIDTAAGVRQFENSVPGARAPLGRSDNYPRSVAGRIGARPARAVLEVSGGQAPQHLVNEFAAVIAGGRAEAVLLAGSEAISTMERYARAEDRPDFTEHTDGSLEDRGCGLRGMVSMHQADPYTRYIVAREKVNQGAAVLLASAAAARRLGVPEDRWVFLHGHADLRERDLMDRADLSAGPAARGLGHHRDLHDQARPRRRPDRHRHRPARRGRQQVPSPGR